MRIEGLAQRIRETTEAPSHSGARDTVQHRPVDWLAVLLSGVASPFVVLPVFAILITHRHSPNVLHTLWWAAIACFFTTVIPFLYILVGVRTGRITDIHIMHRSQRQRPFLVALVSSLGGTAVLRISGAPLPLVVMGLAVVANGVAFGLITLRWKISMHPSVYTAAVLSAAYLVDDDWLWALALLPTIIWARIYRTRHSPAQGVAAVLLAGAVTLLIFHAFGYDAPLSQ